MEDRMDVMQRQMDDKFQQLLDAMQNCQPRTGHRPHVVHDPLVGNRFACLGEADAPDIATLEDDQDYIQTMDQYKSNAGARGQRTRGSRTFDYSKIEPIADDAEFKDFKLWRKKWEANAKNKTIELFGRDEQVSAIMDAIGPTAASIVECYKKVDINDKDTTVEDILAALHDYYRSNRSLALDREAFHKRIQGETETFAKFKCALDKLAEDADLCPSCSEDQIVTQIIIGIREDEIKEKLLQVQPFPTLEEAMKICHTMESAIKNRETLLGKSVNKVSSYKKDKQRARSSNHRDSGETGGRQRAWSPDYRDSEETSRRRRQWSPDHRDSAETGGRQRPWSPDHRDSAETGGRQRPWSPDHRDSGETGGRQSCQFCGGNPHPREKCFAKNMECRKCFKMGYIERMCRADP